MNAKFVYFVGKPYPHREMLEVIRRAGYKIGVFQDSAIRLKNPAAYDRIIPLDFSSTESLLHGLDRSALQAYGLLCTYENYILAKSVLGNFLDLPAATLESAKFSTDKLLMRQAFMRANPAITPRFAAVRTLDDIQVASRTLQYPLIIKPANLVKSLLVMKCNNETELVRNFRYATTKLEQLYEEYHVYGRQPRLIVEEYMSGAMYSVAAFVDHEGLPHFCEGIVRLNTAQEKGIDDSYIFARQLPSTLPSSLVNDMLQVAREGIRALNMRSTPAHIELIHTGDGVRIIEIGARVGGYRPQMYYCCYGIDLLRAELAIACGELPELHGQLRARCAVYELFPEQEGIFASLEGVIDIPRYDYFSLKATPGKLVGPAEAGYKACAIIRVCADDVRQFKALCRIVESMRATVV